MKIVAKRLKQAREQKGWYPKDLALASGVSASRLAAIETGKTNNQHLSTIKKIAAALGDEDYYYAWLTGITNKKKEEYYEYD